MGSLFYDRPVDAAKIPRPRIRVFPKIIRTEGENREVERMYGKCEFKLWDGPQLSLRPKTLQRTFQREGIKKCLRSPFHKEFRTMTMI